MDCVSVLSVDYGEIQGTILDPTSEQGFQDTEILRPYAYSVIRVEAIPSTNNMRWGFWQWISVPFTKLDINRWFLACPFKTSPRK